MSEAKDTNQPNEIDMDSFLTSDAAVSATAAIKKNPLLFHDDVDGIVDKIKELIETLGESNFIEAARISGSVENTLLRQLQERSVTIEASSEYLREHNPTLSHELLDSSGKKVICASNSRRLTVKDSKNLTKAEQMLAVITANSAGGLWRFPLLNSCATVDLKKVSSAVLDTFVAHIRDANSTYGHTFGFHWTTMNDIYIKEAAVRAFHSCISGSSIKGFVHYDNFIDSVRLFDFNALVMALAKTTYPDGFPQFSYACPKCKQVTSVSNVDLVTMTLHNFPMLSEANVNIMANLMRGKNSLTNDDYVKYHQDLKVSGNPDTKENCIEIGQYCLVLRSPTLKQYFSIGERFMNRLINDVHLNDEAALNNALVHRIYRQYVPFIEKIRLTHNDGSVYDVYDLDAIETAIDTIQTDDLDQGRLPTEITNYVERSTVTRAGIPVFECTNHECKHIPETSNGYLTIDPLANFFTIALYKLIT